VQGGQQKSAAARATDLETAWDDAAASLQAKNPDRWQTLDGQVDAVLKSVRAKKPDQAAEVTALTTLLNSLAG
jgi:adenosyl cobinamide kinase/adenosyl cobinamide phosphate guanylyltransferase